MPLPVARLGDMHICPMVAEVVPRVGAQLFRSGELRSSAACRRRRPSGLRCPPDIIVTGFALVVFGGKPAARIGDTTAHGGGSGERLRRAHQLSQPIATVARLTSYWLR
jgi:uncharacterized Zn-binding protein involved in type VI secretion